MPAIVLAKADLLGRLSWPLVKEAPPEVSEGAVRVDAPSLSCLWPLSRETLIEADISSYV